MAHKRDKKPPQAAKALRLGDRPPFISQKQHYVIQSILVLVGIAFVRYLHYVRLGGANPLDKASLPLAEFSANFNRSNSSDDGIKYLWEAADGRTFGLQSIYDGPLNITTKWFNRQNSWASEIALKRRDQGVTGLILYFLAQDPDTTFRAEERHESPELWVHRPGQGDFSLKFDLSSKKPIALSLLTVKELPEPDPTKLVNVFKQNLIQDEGGNIVFKPSNPVEGANLFALHFDVRGDAEILVEYRDETEPNLPNFEDVFDEKLKAFDEKVHSAFIGEDTKVDPETYNMAKAAISNMLGGIGYWSGKAKLRSKHWSDHHISEYGPLELFSAVPSRPFFPRGFIWDEGFHNVLIHKIDPELSLDIVASWLNTINVEGWIPREMILGKEAESKVPSEFLVQSDEVANPPGFLFLIDKFVQNQKFMSKYRSRILSMYPRLKLWYTWLRDTQQGPYYGVLQWQGRNSSTNLELNPKTLPSGLDDFPRASHPSSDEYHLDLRCWLAVGSRVIRYLAELTSDNAFIEEVDNDQRVFNDVEVLDKYHWSEEAQRYADFGLHSRNVKLEKIPRPNAAPLVVRKVLEPPTKRFVDDVYGYVNLFPFLLRLLPSDSPKLGIILAGLDNPEELWSPYGLRSLAKTSPYYMKHNTEHDPPYWRGAVWINMNYLALEALNHYAKQGGTHSDRAESLYERLKHNVVSNVRKQFNETGLFWENYNDRTGKGQGTRPFTGWTALVFAVVADNYE